MNFDAEIQKSPLVNRSPNDPGVRLPQNYFSMFEKHEGISRQFACSVSHEGVILVLQGSCGSGRDEDNQVFLSTSICKHKKLTCNEINSSNVSIFLEQKVRGLF